MIVDSVCKKEVAPAALVEDVAELVSPPDVCVRVLELVNSDKAGAGDFAKVISQDPGLTAKLLKLVNSPYYHYPKRIDTVSRAVAVIGIAELVNLVLAVSAVSSFSRIPNLLVNMDTFWRHSLYVGMVARKLAQKCHVNVMHPERLFVAGLLHDIGHLILFRRFPDLSRELLLLADREQQFLVQAEAEELGFTHADVAGLLLERWQLPGSLCEAIRYHHAPAQAGDAKLEAALIELADQIADYSEIGALLEESKKQDVLAIPESAQGITGLQPESISDIVAETAAEFAGIAASLCVRG